MYQIYYYTVPNLPPSLSHTQFGDLVRWRDGSGNSVAHHLAYAGLRRALDAVYSHTPHKSSALRWAENQVYRNVTCFSSAKVQTLTLTCQALETPALIADGFVAAGLASRAKSSLHSAVCKGNLFQPRDSVYSAAAAASPVANSPNNSAHSPKDSARQRTCALVRMAMRCPESLDVPNARLADIIKCLQVLSLLVLLVQKYKY
jgi:hypothetical protein